MNLGHLFNHILRAACYGHVLFTYEAEMVVITNDRYLLAEKSFLLVNRLITMTFKFHT